MSTSRRKLNRLLITLLVFFTLVIGTLIAVKFAKGYRPTLRGKNGPAISGTGLLSATSYPESAKIFIDDRLSGATNSTIYLEPGVYQIKITKEGYHPWEKQFPIAKELVSSTDTRLFPSLPAIAPITYSGIQQAIISPDGTKILYVTSSATLKENNGLYVISLNSGLSSTILNNSITQIATLADYDYTKFHFLWSPNSSEILAYLTSDSGTIASSHLLNPRTLNKNKDLTDITIKLATIVDRYEEEISLNRSTSYRLLPDFMVKIASESATNIFTSPDQEKLLYTITKDIKLPENHLKNQLPSLNPTSETRDLITGSTYVYDLKEGTNYLIKSNQTSSPTPTTKYSSKKTKAPIAIETVSISDKLDQIGRITNPVRSPANLIWYPTSRHLFDISSDQIQVVEYDGNNRTTIFKTNVIDNFAIPSPDGHRLIVLTNLNQGQTPSNLFAIDLK